jgi:hypothetical protein
VADSDALRSRRKRLHAANDHSLCRRCSALRAAVAVPAASGTGESPVDAQASLERQARRLEQACEADPGNAPLEKELRACLLVLRGPAETVDRELADFLADFRSA